MRLMEILEPRHSRSYNLRPPPYNFDNVRGIPRIRNAVASHASNGVRYISVEIGMQG